MDIYCILWASFKHLCWKEFFLSMYLVEAIWSRNFQNIRKRFISLKIILIRKELFLLTSRQLDRDTSISIEKDFSLYLLENYFVYFELLIHLRILIFVLLIKLLSWNYHPEVTSNNTFIQLSWKEKLFLTEVSSLRFQTDTFSIWFSLSSGRYCENIIFWNLEYLYHLLLKRTNPCLSV